MTSSLSNNLWWVQLRRKFKQALFYVWGTLGVDLIINAIANFTTMTTDTPLSKLFIIHLAMAFPIPVSTCLIFLVLLTIFVWTGGREHDGVPTLSLDQQ